jgi:hypothetical protein
MTTRTNFDFASFPKRIHFRRGLAFGIIIVGALIAFEAFNYSTTEFALTDLLGDLSFMGIAWATILAIAFCGIDFAGIARLFTPEEGDDEPTEVWYLFGAWLLAATMNAMLTWWGVSQAIMSNSNLGNGIIPQETVIRVVPIFVAILVWLVRVMIIGTFSVAGERLFSQGDRKKEPKITSGNNQNLIPAPGNRMMNRTVIPAPTARASTSASAFRPAPKTNSDQVYNNSRAEPTYQDLTAGSPINSAQNAAKMNSAQPYNTKHGNTNFR